VLEPADRTLGDFGRGDQFGDRGLDRVLIRLSTIQALIEHHAVANCQH
jgi:hypothetical protein